MPLSEKVRVEIFIPDLPDPSYSRLCEEFETTWDIAWSTDKILAAAVRLEIKSRIKVL